MSFCCNVGGEKTESLFPVVNRQLRGNTSLQLISNITTYLWDATNGWALSSRSMKITLLQAMQLELKVFIAWETIQCCDTFLCSSTFTRYCIKKKMKSISRFDCVLACLWPLYSLQVKSFYSYITAFGSMYLSVVGVGVELICLLLCVGLPSRLKSRAVLIRSSH